MPATWSSAHNLTVRLENIDTNWYLHTIVATQRISLPDIILPQQQQHKTTSVAKSCSDVLIGDAQVLWYSMSILGRIIACLQCSFWSPRMALCVSRVICLAQANVSAVPLWVSRVAQGVILTAAFAEEGGIFGLIVSLGWRDARCEGDICILLRCRRLQ